MKLSARLVAGLSVVATLSLVQLGSVTLAAHSGTPTCRSSQLLVRLGQSQGAMGHQEMQFRLRNRSMQACQLIGRPRVLLLKADGHALPTHQHHGPGYMTGTQPRRLVRIVPGGKAYFAMEWEDIPTGNEKCRGASSIRVKLPNAPGFFFVNVKPGDVAPCGGDIIVTRIEPKPIGS